MLTSTPRLSVVIPVYRAAESLPELHRRLVAVLEAIAGEFEILFVEDCGGDRNRTGARLAQVIGGCGSQSHWRRTQDGAIRVAVGYALGAQTGTRLVGGAHPVGGQSGAGGFSEREGVMVLLHGFIKKSEKTPKDDLELAHHRLKELKKCL